MKLVKTEEARPGQKVARDVTDLRGNLLFKAGTELSAALLSRCGERNVSHLFIEDEGLSPALSTADLDLKKQTLVKDVDRMFAGTEGNPLMVALREASKRYLVSKVKK